MVTVKSVVYIDVYSLFLLSELFQLHLAELIHRMGGSIRKDISSKVTHLVADSTNGEKYRVSKICRK